MEHAYSGGHISKIVLGENTCVPIQKNDIVVFVGPNNAGKSQALRDIYHLCHQKTNPIVVKDLWVSKSPCPLSQTLSLLSDGLNLGNRTRYSILNENYSIYEHSDRDYRKNQYHGEFYSAFVANLDTAARLTICLPPNSISRDGQKSHPIHYAAFDGSKRKWLSSNFKKAFGIDLIPNTQFGATIPLCLGEPVQLSGKYADEQERQEAYAAILSKYKKVHDQGDGIKSFVGILLYLMMDHFCTYLIDEPESFLHPPQAHIMGQIIGQTLSENQQAFISTHSEDIIKGLLAVCPERLKIVRITRKDDINCFSILENKTFSDIWSDPLLKYSNIMSSLFHKSVVLCESDSDCKMYAAVESHIKASIGKYSETLFVHCGGKHRMSKIITALRSLNIPIILIPDIDVLNDESIFMGITQAFGLSWDDLQKDYRIIASNLHSSKEKIARTEARATILSIIDSKAEKELSSAEINAIKSSVKISSKWDNLKASGVASLPAGDATAAFNRLDRILRDNGVYLVPVGELECFIKEIGGHGPEWVNKVFEKYPDMNNDVYSGILKFIAQMNL